MISLIGRSLTKEDLSLLLRRGFEIQKPGGWHSSHSDLAQFYTFKMSIDKRGPKLGDAASLYVLFGMVECENTRPLLLLLLRRAVPPGNASYLRKHALSNSFYIPREWKMSMVRMDHT